jgi:hypothetical protein
MDRLSKRVGNLLSRLFHGYYGLHDGSILANLVCVISESTYESDGVECQCGISLEKRFAIYDQLMWILSTCEFYSTPDMSSSSFTSQQIMKNSLFNVSEIPLIACCCIMH